MSRIINKLKKQADTLKNEVTALYIASKRKDVPIAAKILSFIVVAYALSPIDLIPDFIPVIGYLDDLILIPLGIFLVLKLIPKRVMEECRKEAEKEVEGKTAVGRMGIFLTIGVWLLIIFMLIKILVY